jgi:hypothetical protein
MRVRVGGDKSGKRDEQPNINFADGQTIRVNDFVYAWHRNTKNGSVGIVLGCEDWEKGKTTRREAG